MKRIAIPVESGKLSAHFGHAPFFYVYETEGTQIIKEEMQTPPAHEFGSIPNWLAEIKVTDLITGGIGAKAVDILNNRGVNVHTGASIDKAQKIIADFLADNLTITSNMCNQNNHNEGGHTCSCKH